jgi:integrase/recombinase XerD
MRRLVRILQQRGIGSLAKLTRTRLRACAPADRLDDRRLSASVRLLERYLECETSLYPPRPRSRIEQRVAAYATYLDHVRGLAASTVTGHCDTAAALLASIGYESRPEELGALTAQDIEGFIRRAGSRLGRASLQRTVAHLRAFLRFVASAGETSTGLDRQIDTPRIYREEQLPRALPWETVEASLQAIDRTSPRGRRDYAIFLLIATYGLRRCDIVALTLDDVAWRGRRLRIRQRKTGRLLWLPLTDEVAAALLDYLRRGRPQLGVRRYRRGFQTDHPQHREVFLRCLTPAGVLKPTAITEAFQAWSRRSGLSIPFQGVHCLRHSYALHLLRSGLSLKTIGDLLGHRSVESTCVYLRLATEDLRDVPLCLPVDASLEHAQEIAR